MYKKITLASHQFRKRTFTRRNTSINHRNIVIEPKKVSQVVLSPHHPHGSLTPRQKISISPFSNNPTRVQYAKYKLERFTEKKWRPRACSQEVEKSGWKRHGIIKRKKREREGKEKGRKKKIGERIETSFREQSSSWLGWRRAIGQILDR